jgi:uncharacterized protein YlxW (UPF0749 family)
MTDQQTPSDDQTPNGETADDQTPNGETADDQTPDDQTSDGETSDGETADDQTPPPAPRRRGPSAASAVVAILLFLLGFTMVVQMRSVATDPTLAAARQEDLVRILADLDAHEERLRNDIAELEDTFRRLTTAGQAQQEALAEAARRADELGILAGTLPVEGPGLVVEIRSGSQGLSSAVLLDAVQELRGAGAEAIQISGRNGTAVRVVARTFFLDHEQGIVVGGELVRSPYTITVIGEPQTLRPALTIPGGVVESVHSLGGTVTMQDEPDGVLVSAVRAPAALQYASPVS